MWIPFKRTPEGMKNTNKTRDKFLDMLTEKHTKNDTAYSMKQAVKERERSSRKKWRRSSSIVLKDTVTMCTVNKLKGHTEVERSHQGMLHTAN